MKRILDNGKLSLTRLVLMLGVLAAIVFSNGEGISLLPFSHSDSNGEISATQSAENEFNSYVYSVHGSGKLRNSFASEQQKNLKDFSHDPVAFLFHPANIPLNDAALLQARNFDASAFFAASGILSEPSDRAPPLI